MAYTSDEDLRLVDCSLYAAYCAAEDDVMEVTGGC